MRRDRKPRAVVIAALAASLVAAAMLFAWSGFYNIAASKGHWPPVKWFLAFGMQSSVRTHAIGINAPDSYTDDQAILGAGHYQSACASCHGASGVPINEAASRMLPPPPDLAAEVSGWRDRELFWIVKHGIKYTGMPSWVAQQRDDEVWAVVAFLKRYPSLDAEGYRRLAFGPLQAAPQDGTQIATVGGPAADAAGACGRCHGADRRGPASKLVPLLHGQPKEFLVAALEQFASGARPSGFMQPIAAALTPDTINAVASYYAALSPPREITRSDPAITRGRQLADNGDHSARIPACTACHNRSALPIYPRLAGQNAPYMAQRLKLWKEGLAGSTGAAAIMTPIARALTVEQIDELATYYASLSPDAQQP
jgi:cytochrome c553